MFVPHRKYPSLRPTTKNGKHSLGSVYGTISPFAEQQYNKK